jgi:hypothetical protein
VTGTPDGDRAHAELEELRAGFPGWRISREQDAQHVSYIAHRVCDGVSLGVAGAATPAQLSVMLSHLMLYIDSA